MRIAFFAAECSPLIKVGGLADVVGALPKALAAAGHDVRIFIPNYESIDQQRFPSQPTPWTAQVWWEDQPVLVNIRETVLPNSTIPVYLVNWPDEFSGAVYPLGQDTETLRSVMRRFVRFSVALSGLITNSKWQPEIIHCHDWHTALVPALLRSASNNTPTILTIHNIDIQGKWSAAEVLGWLGSNHEPAAASWPSENGDLNLLRLGINSAAQVTTVSPTYASEVLTKDFGEGLENDLRERGVIGILNGIDTDSYDPARDQALATTYDANSLVTGKAANKAALQAELGLPVVASAPLFVNVGRLVDQKGVDLIIAVLNKIVAAGGQVALLGSGFPALEKALQDAESLGPIRARLGFDSVLGRLLYAGGDFFLMPSRFEPCGLGQMIAMRYGSLPIGRNTGGLHDTINDIDSQPDAGTGLLFPAPTSDSLWSAVDRAFRLYHDQPRYIGAVRRSMLINHSWYTSAKSYGQLYDRLQQEKTGFSTRN